MWVRDDIVGRSSGKTARMVRDIVLGAGMSGYDRIRVCVLHPDTGEVQTVEEVVLPTRGAMSVVVADVRKARAVVQELRAFVAAMAPTEE